jgi:hypothetical protein
LNQNTTVGSDGGKFKPVISHSFVSKVTSKLEHHPELNKKNFKLYQNTNVATGSGKYKPITSHSFLSKVTNNRTLS